ncbi:hypothetical protein LI136_23895, partial [Bacteroides fragilis]|nr:hypothetical protein [Bacteroides fragilis]
QSNRRVFRSTMCTLSDAYISSNAYDITTKQEEKALETLEGENQKKMRKKWKTEEGKANLEILLGLTKTN